MFQQGDCVVYGIHGVCNITDIQVQNVSGKKLEYFVLEPTDNSGARFLIPTQNEMALAKVRPVVSREVLTGWIRDKDSLPSAWIEDENQRKQRYRELICSGDAGALMAMVHALNAHKAQIQASGCKFHICDENFLRDAQKLLASEISKVLEIPASQAEAYVFQI